MITIEELRKYLLQRLEKEKVDFTKKSLHLLERPLKAGTQLSIGPNKYGVPKESFLVVIDEAPGAYWTHPVRYELHDVNTAEVTTILEQYPLEKPVIQKELVALHIPDLPHLKKKENEDFFGKPQGDLGSLKEFFAGESYDLDRPCMPNRHALFVTGMDNMDDFHNDFANMYQILTNRYGYDPANIVVVMGDGTSYADLPVDYSGTVADLDTALDTFAAGGSRELGADDDLFIYTFNHGGFDGANSYLCMWPDWGSYYDYQLLAKLNNINCNEVIVAMNQCHSGGFIDDVITTTGPTSLAILTTCREDQSGYPAATGDHGYFSVVLCAALNWAFPDATFPAPIDPAFPGYTAGDITAQDLNGDGMVSADEAFQYVSGMMAANHWATIAGIETPQWGESTAGIGSSLFWGTPYILVQDGSPYWWESEDVYLNDPTVTPDDSTADPSSPAYWGDNYHPDTINRIVARVHNIGCAPCRDITVEFRVTSSGVGGGTSLVGTGTIDNIDPGCHGFAWFDWDFPSELIHRCVMVRADCAADPALPYGTPITSDDKQAQRNIDPAYAAPGYGGPAKAIERTMIVRNELKKEAVFTITPGNIALKSKLIQPEIPKLDSLRQMKLKANQTKEIPVRFIVSPKAKKGEKIRFPVVVRRDTPARAVIGGVTFTVEVAEGRLEGRILSRPWVPVKQAKVVIEHIKQKGYKYSTEVTNRGLYTFKNIAPGPYRVLAESKSGSCKGSVFVTPNAITRKNLILLQRGKVIGGVLKGDSGKAMAKTQISLVDKNTQTTYLVRTNAKGEFHIPELKKGEYIIKLPEKKDLPAKKVALDFLSLK